MGCPEVLCVSFLIGMLMTYGCRSMYVRETTSERYTIYVNGIIYTVNPKDPDWDKYPEEAMVINQITGKIVFIGTTQKALKYDLGNFFFCLLSFNLYYHLTRYRKNVYYCFF